MSDIEFFLRENKKVKKYSDFPTSSWSPRYVYLSEHALVDVLWANEDTKQLLERILPLDNPSKTAMFECDRMILGYRDKVSLQSQDKDLTRFKLKGTISTNGLVLNLLAYDTTQTKKQQQSDVDEEDPSQELELSQGFLSTTCSKAAGRCPSANTTTIVGCDPGIVNAFTFSSLYPHNPNLRQTVRKREKGMIEVESAIPVFGRDTYNEYFQWMNEESQTQIGSKNLDAQRATFDYVVQRVLKMLGEKGVLVVGLGSFESSKGVPSKHTAITRHLVTQVKARGHFAVGVHEFYTSARCPRPLCDSFLETVYPRSKYCRTCKVFFDRDAVGAENIAKIGLAQIERQERPAKYKPTEESPAPAAKRARR
ncbi:hypothetical protein BCR41DRAFT_353162 [Lobosporangium transversale]|uniref:Cas12f1-like TNB domain-containing protein n=1 Tax=Lobosporangium transversale TaxID=64571 RepID=A0A1Y2GSZ8_9FUNG|nr:hypothetical protein BCR41DRAFT_353162 [Lobosporangium transversale]ORZ16775.1 hypothetical protein BCR41DRAFT_353162 [Lobosporangium transversale]|eukprot:XP_021881710.1 hypothetical protein BCR41DRAFT_353162 [Lobosporangium transversale]